MRPKILSLGLGVFLLLTLSAAPVQVSADVPHSTIIAMSNTMFVPQVTAINVGDTVTWTNYDKVPHTVTSTTDSFNVSSGLLQSGDKFSFTFAKGGVFTYYCQVHPFMVGWIYVGVQPPQSVTIQNPSTSPGLKLIVNKPNGGSVTLTASLGGVAQSQASGVPVSFFARYAGNSSTYWLKLDTRPIGLNGSAQLTLPSSSDVTGFQAYCPQVGNIQAGYSNVVNFGAPAPGADPTQTFPYVTFLIAAAVAALFLWLLFLRRPRVGGGGFVGRPLRSFSSDRPNGIK